MKSQIVVPSKIGWVDVAKGLSIILVVLTHVFYWLDSAGIQTASPFGIGPALIEMRLPLFFFTAGLFSGKYLAGPWRTLTAKRLIPFAWLFAIWQLIAVGYSILAGVFIHAHDPSATIVRSLIKPAVSIVRPSNELWFLWVLILLLIVGKLIWKLPPSLIIAVSFVVSVVVFGLPQEIYARANDLVAIGWLGLAQYAVLFYAAAIVGTRGAGVIARFPIWGAALIALGSGSLMAWFMTLDLGYFGVLFPTAAFVCGVALARMLHRVPILQTIGQATLPIYVMHTTLVVALVIALLPIKDELNALPGGDIAYPIAITAVVTALSFYLHRALIKTPGRYLFEPPARLVSDGETGQAAPPNSANRIGGTVSTENGTT